MDDKGRFVFIIGNSEIDTTFLRKVFMAAAEKLNVKAGLAIAIGFTVQEGTELPASYNAASELLDSSVGETVLIAQNRQLSVENGPLTENIRALFHGNDRSLRKEGFKKIALELYETSDASAGEKAAAHLSRSIMRAFTLEFPGEDESLERLRERLRLFSLPGAGDDFIAKTTDLFDYANTLYQYRFEKLSAVVQTAVAYIHKHYAAGLSIKIFCSRRKLSTPYVGYLFKKETGMFFNNYLNQFRIGKVIELLDRTDYSIQEIAEKAGFSSVSYFISCFKRETGISPVKYRETIEE
jgi:YesN/AraC family two-component response regulator